MSLLKLRTVPALAAIALCQAQTRVDLRTQSKSVDFSAASSTKPSQTGASLPATCTLGQTFLNTNAQPGQNWYVCTAANVWTLQGIGTGTYSTSFASVTSVTVTGTTHQLSTASLIVEVYDNGNPASMVEPDSVVINPSTYDVLVKFATPQSGIVVISAAGGGGAGGGSATFLTTMTTLAFGSIASQGCGELTFALPGAATGDAVAPGWPGAWEAGLIGTMRVSTANTIAVRLCNLSGAVLTPASAPYRATIVKSF